jgi:hypothetical protein
MDGHSGPACGKHLSPPRIALTEEDVSKPSPDEEPASTTGDFGAVPDFVSGVTSTVSYWIGCRLLAASTQAALPPPEKFVGGGTG